MQVTQTRYSYFHFPIGWFKITRQRKKTKQNKTKLLLNLIIFFYIRLHYIFIINYIFISFILITWSNLFTLVLNFKICKKKLYYFLVKNQFDYLSK